MLIIVCLFDWQMQLFFESIKEQISELRAVQIALDNVQKNICWMQRNLEPLRNWLNEQMKTGGEMVDDVGRWIFFK